MRKPTATNRRSLLAARRPPRRAASMPSPAARRSQRYSVRVAHALARVRPSVRAAPRHAHARRGAGCPWNGSDRKEKDGSMAPCCCLIPLDIWTGAIGHQLQERDAYPRAYDCCHCRTGFRSGVSAPARASLGYILFSGW
jgi:hypothetical protein